jgi:hypothetical protein
MQYTYGDHDEGMVRLARWVYACAIRDAMQETGRYFWSAFDERAGAFNPQASTPEQEYARKIRDDIAALLPKKST